MVQKIAKWDSTLRFSEYSFQHQVSQTHENREKNKAQVEDNWLYLRMQSAELIKISEYQTDRQYWTTTTSVFTYVCMSSVVRVREKVPTESSVDQQF